MTTRTLSYYRRLASAAYGPDSKAVAFIDRKIKESPRGDDEPVLADHHQMLILLDSLG